jgi:archaellum component FlaC
MIIMFGFNKRQVLRSPQQMFQEAEQKIQDAFSMFSQAHNAVEEADRMIMESVEENKKVLTSLEAQVESVANDIQKAQDNLQANSALKARLKEFIPQR